MLLTGLLAATCGGDRSFVVVSVVSSEADVTAAQFRVDVRNGVTTDVLTYPRTPTADLTFTRTAPVTLSVSFRTSWSGLVEVGVTALSAGGEALAYGAGAHHIDPGHTTRMTVVVSPGASPPVGLGRGDGGLPRGSDAGVPSPLSCDPAAPSTCGSARTCFVGCQMEQAMGLCTKAGAGAPGDSCKDNADCQPGSQCFEFPCAASPNPRICMRFCSNDETCGEGRRCSIGVPCGGKASGFHVCTQSCDPRGAATKGCAPGLHCFMFPGETTDCDCRGSKRTGAEGSTCSEPTDCGPGLLCVLGAGTTGTCRPICRLDAPDCAADRTCRRLSTPDYKMFGACLPN